jgi:transcriptional regulator with XRE-family HTH domain
MTTLMTAEHAVRNVDSRSARHRVAVGGVVRGREAVAESGLSFGALLRQFRGEAQLTQEELAEAASLSPRSVSDLERGIHQTARKDTALVLADALGLRDPVRTAFVAVPRALPRDAACFTGRRAELAQLTATATLMRLPATLPTLSGSTGASELMRRNAFRT